MRHPVVALAQANYGEILLNPNALIKANYQQILFVFIAFLAMVLVSYVYVSNIVQTQMQIIGDTNMDTTQTAVAASLAESGLLFANVVQAVEGLLTTEKSNEDVLNFLRHTNEYFNAKRSPLPNFMKVYGHIRGEFLDGSGWTPPKDYAPEQRPWHIGAKGNNGRIFFSEPYEDAETGGTCISFSQMLFDQHGVAYGILAIDLQLDQIITYVENKKIAGNGYGVLIDDKNNFITHRNKDLVGTNINDAGGDYAKLGQLFRTDSSISAVRFQDIDKTDSIVFFRKIFNGWYIGIIIPRTSYYHEVNSLAAVLGVMGFVLMCALSYMLVRTRVEKMRSEEESRSKSSFLARMSHEMRTPMNAIIGMADIAKASSDPEKKEYCLNRIGEASNHLLGVINDVLDMSKIEAGKLELSETDFVIKNMLRQVSNVINYKIGEKRQHFTIEVDDDVPVAIVADRQRLAQVITNFLSNANKFTPEEGTISLRVHRLSATDKYCVLQFEVQDNGIGIAPEQQARLFRSFEQADGSISRKYGGTGLGLSISKKIVEMMKGKVWVESELNKGSRFIFTVCVSIGSAQPEEKVHLEQHDASYHETQQNIFAGKRVLLAEDVALNREILISLLDGTGVKIDSAENGHVACEMFAAAPDRYDMIFMDIHMPDMDGYEATRCIRNMDLVKAQTIPIIAMTANVFKEDIEKCHACGMNAHLGKPLEINETLYIMKKYLHKIKADSLP